MNCLEEDLEEDANQILKIPLPRRPLEDQLVWTYDNRGQYKVNSGYYVAFHMKVKDMPSTSSNHTRWWKVFLEIISPNKDQNFLLTSFFQHSTHQFKFT